MESTEEVIEVEEEEGERSSHDHALPLSRPLHFPWLASSSHADLIPMCRDLGRKAALHPAVGLSTGVPRS